MKITTRNNEIYITVGTIDYLPKVTILDIPVIECKQQWNTKAQSWEDVAPIVYIPLTEIIKIVK